MPSRLPITPTFLPYKRYAGPTLLHLAAGYLENDRQSCRQTTNPRGRVIGYQQPPDSSVTEERALHHSALWCLMIWLGSQCAAMAFGRQRIQGGQEWAGETWAIKMRGTGMRRAELFFNLVIVFGPVVIGFLLFAVITMVGCLM